DDLLCYTLSLHDALPIFWKCILAEDKLRLVSDYDVFGPNVFTQDNNGTIWLSTTSEYVYSLKKGDSDFEPLQIYTPFFNFVSGRSEEHTSELQSRENLVY